MSFLKKYPLLTAVLTLLVAAFLIQVYLVFSYKGRASTAEAAAARAGSSLRSLLGSVPAPTDENLQLARQNVSDLQGQLNQLIASIEGQLESTIGQDAPASGSDLLFELQSFVDRRNAEARSADEDRDPIIVPDNFTFGFARFVDSGVPPSNEYVAAIWKQKEILEYLLDCLYAAAPRSIITVEREALYAGTGTTEATEGRTTRQRSTSGARGSTPSQGAGKDLFQINPLISARVPEAIETMAFRISFTGYTDSLRSFLSALAEFDLPIVVRSVEAASYQSGASKAPEQGTRRSVQDAFGSLFGGSAAATPAAPADDPSRRPVVLNNISQFTVVVEFVDVVIEQPETEGAAQNN